MNRPARFECIRTGIGSSIEIIGGVEHLTSGLNSAWFFRVVAQNGRILCHSETYRSRAACLRAIRAVKMACNVVEK